MRKKVWGTIAVATAAVAMFASSQQTFALWSDSININGGSVTGAKLQMQVNSGASTFSSTFPFTALTGTKLIPGNTIQAPLTIKNAGELPMRWRLESTSIYTGLTLSIFAVTAESLCPVGVGQPTPTGPVLLAAPMDNSVQYPSGGWPETQLPVGESAVWCFRVGVTATAVQPSTPQIVFTMAGTNP